MGDTTQEEWNAHYDAHDGESPPFRPLGDAERTVLDDVLDELVPAPPGGLALDVGCGQGELARHLATTGYRVDAIDYAHSAVASAVASATSATSATTEPPDTGEVAFVHFDIERDPLAGLPHAAYDLITFRLSFAFIRDRTRVMNRLRERLRPGGAVCVITPVADAVPAGKRDIALDEEEIGLLSAPWHSVERRDAEGLAVLVLRDAAPSPVAFGNKRRATPHALTGAGVVVTDEAGRVLLGRSVRGVWELPGGKNDGDESFVQAALRELHEETGLRAEVADTALLAILMDASHGVPRVTAAVGVTAFSGNPTVREPELIRRWEWHEVADLPTLGAEIFVPSAHVLDTVWPGLLPDLPPVHRHPIAQPPQPGGC
ncbi:NUDIX domain-containing protein [Streptomyces piniterrae]|uniref:NUDIX domain-containing protein n=1 Tax=Streptomyces piniterrae TaxID=2571125 RepID=A0A4U0NR33_9ACTN|nr:NUDIX domain-containing protein [Streptomyces piniterrae]TJZ57039.1 NUDIX domain-containing protein [Streptomyces piniterrae]